MTNLYKYLGMFCIVLVASCDSGSSNNERNRDNSEQDHSSDSDTTDHACNANADKARYQLTFKDNWSKVNFPTNYPTGAHFSHLIGATHNKDIQLWKPGGKASAGIELMAETGGISQLETKIKAFTTASVGSPVGPLASGKTTSFTVTRATPLFSLVTMIAPSSDWFIGVDSESLLNAANQWPSFISIPLVAYDAGTEEDSPVFFGRNSPTNPQETISLLSDDETDVVLGKHKKTGLTLGSVELRLQCDTP